MNISTSANIYQSLKSFLTKSIISQKNQLSNHARSISFSPGTMPITGKASLQPIGQTTSQMDIQHITIDHQKESINNKEKNVLFETENDFNFFKSSFTPFVQDLIKYSNRVCHIGSSDVYNSPSLTPKQAERIHDLFHYNVSHGKYLRPYLFLECYKHFKTDKISMEDLDYAHKIGWIIETNHSFYCLMDDIMDQGSLRHGRPCWYTLPEVGPQDAIIDGLTLEHGYLLLLQTYMVGKSYCLDVLKLFHETNYQTTSGQQLDILTSKCRNFTEYTMELYTSIITKKTGFYTFYNPIATSLLMNGINDTNLMKAVKNLSLDMSMLFQVQDDYLDCFGDRKKLGKGGNDIQEGKCSWMIVKALENASPAQRKFLIKNYGFSDHRSTSKITELYSDIGIPSMFADFEIRQNEKILLQIQQLPSFMPKKVLKRVVQRLCKRLF